MSRASLRVLAATVAVVLVGALLLKGLGEKGPLDRTISANNGSPYGLLAAARLSASDEVTVSQRLRFDAALPDAGVLVLPPPEGSYWNDLEADALLERVGTGALRLVVLCSGNPRRDARFGPLLKKLKVRCGNSEEALEDLEVRAALPGWPAALAFTEPALVEAEEGGALFPVYENAAGAVAVGAVTVGAGTVMVVASAEPFVNDAIAAGDHAAAWLSLVDGASAVVFEEAHHTLRREEVFSEAFTGAGPRAGVLALLLLVPLSLLSLLPRPGDAPTASGAPESPAARSQILALASMLHTARALDDDAGASFTPQPDRPPKGGSVRP